MAGVPAKAAPPRPPSPRPSPARATAPRPERERAPPPENQNLQRSPLFLGLGGGAPLPFGAGVLGGRTGEGTGVSRVPSKSGIGRSPEPMEATGKPPSERQHLPHSSQTQRLSPASRL